MYFKFNVRKDSTKHVKEKAGIWVLAAIFISLLLFGILCYFQAKLAEGDRKYYKTVYLAAKEIPEGTEITDENLLEYVTATEMDIRVIPSDYITETGDNKNIKELVGQFADKKYLEKDVITLEGFEKYNAREGMNNPVEVSFAVSGVEQVVAGTLREGDTINIYAIRTRDANSFELTNERYSADLLYSGKIVTNAFTSGGAYVENTNAEEFSVWLLCLVIWVWRKNRNHGPAFLFLISVFTANFHGGNLMVMTIVLVILAFTDIVWDIKESKSSNFLQGLRHVIPVMVFIAGSFINPSVGKMWRTSLSMQSWMSTPYIQEWKPWQFNYVNGFIILLTVLSLGYACCKFHFERKVCQDTALVCAVILASMTTIKAGTVLYVIFLLYAYKYVEQMCMEFLGLSNNKTLLRLGAYRPELKLTMLSYVIIGLFVITTDTYEKDFAVLANEGYSPEVMKILKEAPGDTRIFNGYADGNVLLFNDINCFIDSRQFPYAHEYAGNTSLNDYITVIHAEIPNPEEINAFLMKYDFEYIYNTDATKQLEWFLDNEEHNYALVFENNETQESLWKKK